MRLIKLSLMVSIFWGAKLACKRKERCDNTFTHIINTLQQMSEHSREDAVRAAIDNHNNTPDLSIRNNDKTDTSIFEKIEKSQ